MNEKLTELIEIVKLNNADAVNRRQAIALSELYDGIHVGRLLEAARFDNDKEWINALWQESEAIKAQVDTCEPVFFIVQAQVSFDWQRLAIGTPYHIQAGDYFMACDASDRLYALTVEGKISSVWAAKERFTLVTHN